MTDIVQDLRGIQTTCPSLHSTFANAASEIDRLRGALEEVGSLVQTNRTHSALDEVKGICEAARGVPILPAGMTNEKFYKEQAEYWRAQYGELHAHIEKMRGSISSGQEPRVTQNPDGTTTWTDNAGSETR